MTGWSVRQLKNEIAQSVDAVSIRLAVRLASIATDICCRSRSSGSSRGGRRQCLSWRQLYEINSADRRASTPIVTALDVNKPDVRHFCYSSSLQSVFFQPPDMSWCRSAVQIFWQLFIDSCRAQLYLFSSLQCNLASTKICVILYCDLILQICCHLWTTYNAVLKIALLHRLAIAGKVLQAFLHLSWNSVFFKSYPEMS